MGIIYQVENLITNKKYVGQTTYTLNKRWLQHIREAKDALDGKIASFSLFHRMIIKYGAENFKPSILEECKDEELDEKEKFWISKMNTFNNGYNSTIGGQGTNKNQKSYQKVSCFSKEKKYIKTFDTVYLASKEYCVDGSNIRLNCNGKTSYCANLLWQWGDSKQFTREECIPHKGKGKSKQILQLNLNGELVNTYKTIVEASNKTGIPRSGISKTCNGKQKTCRNYIWKFDFL